jgi:uncharacterized protein YxeA
MKKIVEITLLLIIIVAAAMIFFSRDNLICWKRNSYDEGEWQMNEREECIRLDA